MTKLQSVTLNFAPVTIKVSGETNAELLENAKKAFVDQLSADTMPHINSYSVGAADALSFETATIGKIVESKDKKLGIISQVNKKTIYVTYTNGATVSAPPTFFEPSKATFEEARSRRGPSEKEMNFWSAGYSGYIKVKDEILPVIVGKLAKSKVKLHVVGTTQFLPVTEAQMEKLLKDDISEIHS